MNSTSSGETNARSDAIGSAATLLGNVDLFLFYALAIYGLYVLVPSERPRARFWLLLGSSVGLIFMVAPWSLLIAALVTGIGYMWCRYHEQYTFPFKRLAVLTSLLVPLIVIKVQAVAHARYSMDFSYLAISLGIGFMTLKTIAVVFDCFQRKATVELPRFFLLNIFFPIYSAGPIERYDAFVPKHFETRPSLNDFLHGTQRLILGLFKSLFIAETLIRDFSASTWPAAPGDFSTYSTLSLIGFILLKFLYTYVNFSGYMDIAIGVSRWFGLSIMENFNFPVLARNIRDFWRRWHISLGDFVNTYVFFPLLLTFKGKYRAELAIFVSFVLIGLWHEFTFNYLAWGAMHGFGLALLTTLGQSKNVTYARIKRLPFYSLMTWAVTLFYVAFVQTIANLPDLGAGWQLVLAMIL